ncbi:MAG: ATP-dependent sacrificial sulfur transferase LarE [Lachnospiraceae bacterium]
MKEMTKCPGTSETRDNMEAYKETLLRYMAEVTKENVAVAFSGGADSSLILSMAVQASRQNNTQVYAMCIHTTLHPGGESEQARKAAEEMGAVFKEIRVDEFARAGIADNPKDRCYRCKKYMFTGLKDLAGQLGISVIMDGTNEDDLHVYRPGLQALKELGIRSPLAECGITKAQVRELLKEYGIPAAEKPSMPCLATRFPYGTHLTAKMLRQVDEAEKFLRGLGFYNVRVRVHGEVARIEVDVEDEDKILKHRTEIVEKIKALGYKYVTMDLEGFCSGSMDRNL